VLNGKPKSNNKISTTEDVNKRVHVQKTDIIQGNLDNNKNPKVQCSSRYAMRKEYINFQE
jgi:hypothetical protein